MPVTIQEHMDNATLEQALAWQATEEKFTFCIDTLEISAHDNFSDAWVNSLENRYTRILEENGQLLEASA